MKKAPRIAIVVLLVLAIGVVVALKAQNNRTGESDSARVSADEQVSPGDVCPPAAGDIKAGKNESPAPAKPDVPAGQASVTPPSVGTASPKPDEAAKPSRDKPVSPKPASSEKQVTTGDRIPVTPQTQAARRLPKLLELGSDSCIPCKMMATVLDELRREYNGKLEVEFIDIWKNRKAGEKYGVRVIPTQIFFDATGKEIDRHQGYFPKEDIVAKFKEHGIKL